ncbi:hypothetical protein LTR50_003420 [Elasticomyces elasticus]|nr:hypothetical protein LTR50_003420 [Elasticomyces elasticus]
MTTNKGSDHVIQSHPTSRSTTPGEARSSSTLLHSGSTSRHSFEYGKTPSAVDLVSFSPHNGSEKRNDEQYYELDLADGDDGETNHLLSHGTSGLPLVAATGLPQIDEDERPLGASVSQDGVALATESSSDFSKPEPVTWRSLPHKSQLLILTLARLSEPLTQTSLQSYMYYQLRSFSPDAPDSTISSQAGFLAAAFTGAQFLTAIMWGRIADSEKMGLGRKGVLAIGLLGTGIGVLGFGFAGSFAAAMFWRAVGGMLNGNVGVMRTIISEIVKEKKYQSRAFLLLPMTFNIGVIIGPIMGGLLADPVGSYPGLFGKGSTFGGKDGVRWMQKPNIVSAVILVVSALGVILGMEETHYVLSQRRDYGLLCGRWIARRVFCLNRDESYLYHPLDGVDDEVGLHLAGDIELQHRPKEAPPKPRRKLPFRRIWTPNVLFVLLAHGLLASHVGLFNGLWFVFLSTPRYDPSSPIAFPNGTVVDPNTSLHLPSNYHPRAPFTFTGGLALPPRSIGTALAILGVIGITLQLVLYPRLSFRLGTITSYRLSLLLFPTAYVLAPFLALIPSTLAPPHPASGTLLWITITIVLSIQVLARTFALPATAILVNNASPHPSVLGTVHGIGQSVSSAARTISPVLGGWFYGLGLKGGAVGAAWWGMAGVAVVGAIAGGWVRDGDGHEIWLEGEEEEMEGRG